MRLAEWTDRLRRRRQPAPLTDPAAVLAEADRLLVEQRPVAALDRLAAAVRQTSDEDLEVRLRDVRHTAGVALIESPGRPRAPWPPTYPDPRPGLEGAIPETDVADLDEATMGGAVAHHGALLVRNLFGRRSVQRVRQALDRAFASHAGHETDRYFDPFPKGKNGLREHVVGTGGIWLADSPVALAAVSEELADTGLTDVVASHLGERPMISLEKSTLRRTPPANRMTGWHQDGSFLDPGVRTMNVWVALTECGGDRPAAGLEVVPDRVEEILPKNPALGNAGVAFDLMKDLLEATPSIRPEFDAGDALLFDERFLHRTALGPHLEEDRLALECWFFAPSHPSASYTPFLV